MDPGEFDKRISLIRLDQTGRDGAGAPISQRVQVARPWAKVSYPGGKEFLAGDGTDTQQRVVFRIYAREVDVSMLIHFAGRDHDIQDVRPFDDVTEIHTVAQAPGAK
ncbi:Phage head-tail joining protein [compost metagenome]